MSSNTRKKKGTERDVLTRQPAFSLSKVMGGGGVPNIDSPINHKFLTKDNFFPKSKDLMTRMEKKLKRNKAFKGKKMSEE